jgi:WD40 repeat protein
MKTKCSCDRHLDCVRSVSLHSKDLLIASASDDGTVKLWDLKNSIGKDTAGQKKYVYCRSMDVSLSPCTMTWLTATF